MSKKTRTYNARHVMPGGALRSWRGQMADILGLETEISYRHAAQLLGMSPQGYLNCEKNGAPLYIAYACAALLAGIDPFRAKAR